MKKSYEVILLNQKFNLKSDSTDKYVQKVADYVNKKLFDIQENTKSVSSLNVALLAALNIADDYFKIKTVERDKIDKAKGKIKEIVGLIDRCIAS
jgi:cell division protein ZapA